MSSIRLHLTDRSTITLSERTLEQVQESIQIGLKKHLLIAGTNDARKTFLINPYAIVTVEQC
jgi:hypothetical protein